jgi:hypothetical protein
MATFAILSASTIALAPAPRRSDRASYLGADAVSKASEAIRQLRPGGEALADRHVGVNRAKACDMLVARFSGDAAGVYQAGLEAAALLSEADEHA